ncbi:MAG: YceI family protein [Kaistella sp.]|nr:YceI family protein [Kaistella sp.]
MKNLILIAFLLVANFTFSQKYLTKTGNVHFEASVPLFEDVDARNTTVVAVLNADSGDIAVIAMTKKFKFKVALMEEHFNENYAESTKYPKITFTGKIAGFKKENLTSTPQNCSISGTMNFHGVNNKVNSAANIYIKDGKIFLSGKFVAKPADYQVTIPKVVTKKIAENVNVDYQFELLKQ